MSFLPFAAGIFFGASVTVAAIYFSMKYRFTEKIEKAAETRGSAVLIDEDEAKRMTQLDDISEEKSFDDFAL